MKLVALTRQTLACTALMALASLFFASAAAGGEKIKPTVQVLDVATYRLEVIPSLNWRSDIKKEQGCVLFQYTDTPALTIAATIGIFRLIVPVEARGADPIGIATAYATQDVSGAQNALFKSNARLALLSRKAKAINGGKMLSFAEPIDARFARSGSSRFVRAWIFFPRRFAENGVLFLAVGKQESTTLEMRPDELDKAEEIIGGIREPW